MHHLEDPSAAPGVQLAVAEDDVACSLDVAASPVDLRPHGTGHHLPRVPAPLRHRLAVKRLRPEHVADCMHQ